MSHALGTGDAAGERHTEPRSVSFSSPIAEHLKNNLKEGRIYSGSQFLRFQSVVTWLCISGSVGRPSIMAERYSRRKSLTPWWWGSRERGGEGKKEEREVPLGTRSALPGHTSEPGHSA
jgi:hypothetical protein